MANHPNYAGRPIRLKAFIEAFDAWRAWVDLNGFNLDMLDDDEIEELRVLEEVLFRTRDELKD